MASNAAELASLLSGDTFVVNNTTEKVGVGSTTPTTELDVDGTVTATSFVGSGANLTDVISGVELKLSGSSVGTSVTAINFNGVTVTAPVAGLSTISVAQNLTIGVRSGSAVTFSIAGNSFNIPNRAGGNTSINV